MLFHCTTPKIMHLTVCMTHLHHSCSRGRETSTRCPGRPHFQQRPEHIQFYWPTVLCLLPSSEFRFSFFDCSSQNLGLPSLYVESSLAMKKPRPWRALEAISVYF